MLSLISGETKPDERRKIIEHFAPIANRPVEIPGDQHWQPDGLEIQVLISTDVLSEDQNLQDAGIVMNYDLHWNPVRLIQRAGRIDRIGSAFAQALQIADRWHICKNLGDAIEAYFVRQKVQIPPLPPQEGAPQEQVIQAIPPSEPLSLPYPRASQEKREHKQQVVDQVKTMQMEGKSIHTIAAELKLARNTVRRYLRLEEPAQPKLRPSKPNLLDPYYDYLCERFKQGCSNASQLFQEIQEKGYRGGKITVRTFVARLRKGLSGVARPPKHAKNGDAVSASLVSPRELRWHLSKYATALKRIGMEIRGGIH